VEHGREAGDGAGEGVLGRLGVADDERRRVGVRAMRVVAEPLEGQAAGGGVRDDVLLTHSAGELEERVQAGGDPRDSNLGRVPSERGHQPVPPAPVDQARAPDVPVVCLRDDEVREDELVDRAAVAVRERLGGDDVVDQVRREDEPTQPEPGRERLAGGSYQP
jgi:hypothetical protein